MKHRLPTVAALTFLAITLVVGSRSFSNPPVTTEGVKTGQTEQVTYQARLYRFSSSGDMRFERIDSATAAAPSTSDNWFFAMPQNVPSDAAATSEWVKFIQDNQKAIFNISGEKLEPDCDYYDSEKCIDSIEVKDIQIIEE